ncbi:ATP-dependent DNA ligase [Pedobacter psychrophilus]|uniref:DNA ligase (ATP) n=1 Tax=Pedobacter psychrophilus TaxID=1826909 RepID=A0A179DAT5_9SPHI|nr:DNA ligase D [Pedobacter psychrophilus]OAQ38108.1 ATP-dependent DNA ligase [Pedobacter psychrophilus]
MPLSAYDKKRNFEKTSEPKSVKEKSKKGLRFVVQRHHASHLHYDFRLEMDGVLKSWAVPKGPSLNPNDKRLAMMVEDHPYAYRTFEGEIPKGNYGAGTVHQFDEGTYTSLNKSTKDDEKELLKELKAGSLKIKLKGRILKGEFALVKIKSAEQNAWLLIKHNDEYAVNDKFDIEKLIPKEIIKKGKDFKSKKEEKSKPTVVENHQSINYQPMLAKLAPQVFDDESYIYERKIDGYRILANTGDSINLITRNGKDYTSNYEQVVSDLKLIKENAVLDGELVAEDKDGNQKFQLLQNYENDDKNIILKYYVFDILSLNNHDVTELPLLKRKALLKSLISQYKFEHIILMDFIEGEGKQLFTKAKKEGWEGIIGKKAQDEYYIGKRSDTWLKFKFVNSEEAIICGYTKPTGSRKYFGALVLGMIDEKGQLKYIGNCGTGFNDDTLKSLYDDLNQRILVKKPLSEKVNQEKTVTWVRPELVCEVNYTEWTEDGHLRHPVFKGLREDKDADEVNLDDMEKDDNEEESVNEKELELEGKKVKVTNLDKVFWKKEGYTKGDLINYYEEIGDEMLPYLKDKPLSLNRHPNGMDKPSFFQKDVALNNLPKWAKTAEMHSDSNNKEINYLVCNDKASLIYMANLGCIEINPWLSTFKKPENPEFMVIDLDPDGNKFSEVVEIALIVKSIFDEIKIKSFVKTSGSSGIHIYVYIAQKYDYDFVKNFAEFIANKVHEQSPKNTSIDRSPSKRKGLIYIDFLQNRRGQTIAAPYSVRPKPGATVSMPLDWKDVNEDLDMNDFTILTVPDLIKNSKNPWEGINNEKSDLVKGLKLLSK